MATRTDSQMFASPSASSGVHFTPSTSEQIDPADALCAAAPDPRVCALFADRLRVNQHSLDRR